MRNFSPDQNLLQVGFEKFKAGRKLLEELYESMGYDSQEIHSQLDRRRQPKGQTNCPMG
ncbi:hypothetical protein Mapa_017542 [Marchantia paleacea]|nr:hypothetical protein Mapa_017542 [Marchantia paleacea]